MSVQVSLYRLSLVSQLALTKKNSPELTMWDMRDGGAWPLAVALRTVPKVRFKSSGTFQPKFTSGWQADGTCRLL